MLEREGSRLGTVSDESLCPVQDIGIDTSFHGVSVRCEILGFVLNFPHVPSWSFLPFFTCFPRFFAFAGLTEDMRGHVIAL